MIFLVIIIFALYIFFDFKKYIVSSYYLVTKNSYLSVRFDKGKLGEYHIYKYLRNLEKSGSKFLFNVYIPKENGETTEIDVLLITTKGIFVFESKNYSGWIFGSENQRYWTQTLPQGKGKSHKEKFFNPIMQNATHIKHLKALVGEDIPYFSIIAFSERCTLKKIDKSSDVKVINRGNVPLAVKSIMQTIQENILSTENIDKIHYQLYDYTQVNDEVKQQHIQKINSKFKSEEGIISLSIDEQQQNDKCPCCGGDLILRVIKKGENTGKEFYGCSNFPKCRYKTDKK